jgi:hypothetical protein
MANEQTVSFNLEVNRANLTEKIFTDLGHVQSTMIPDQSDGSRIKAKKTHYVGQNPYGDPGRSDSDSERFRPKTATGV